jgi:hypothetical protein
LFGIHEAGREDQRSRNDLLSHAEIGQSREESEGNGERNANPAAAGNSGNLIAAAAYRNDRLDAPAPQSHVRTPFTHCISALNVQFLPDADYWESVGLTVV